ncbi:MAG: hypothetical protein JF887_07035 [Candidatus Dormibacteraeota bacterium]|uniref:Uncharacterized protein n=1 Tax=Candidatus Amunia macphersoniae TaxID=3127014 RepID=A0A934N9L2_9BACT|nr:hypothetical protein [Candidatus Dormibacteraeota bacterium]
MTSASRRTAAAAVVLLAGAALTVAMGLTRHHVQEIVIALGATLLAAWLVERGRRFVGSGCTLLALGIALTVADHIEAGRYRDELIFLAVAAALLSLRALHASTAYVASAMTLLSVAALEVVLTITPASLSGGPLYLAFSDGWAYGVLLAGAAAGILARAALNPGGDRPPYVSSPS